MRVVVIVVVRRARVVIFTSAVRAGRLVAWVSVVCRCGSTTCVHVVAVVNAREVKRWEASLQYGSSCVHAC